MTVATFFLASDPNIQLSLNMFLVGTFAGICMCISRILLAIAIATGIAGPAQSLNSTHAFH